MVVQRVIVYGNALLSAALVVGLLAAGLMSSDKVNRVEVPASFSWSVPREESTDAFANDGAQLSSEAFEAEEDTALHPLAQHARRLVAMDRAEAAIALLEDALRTEPGSAGLHSTLGTTLLRLGRVDEGLARFDAAISIQSGEPRYHYNRATALLRDASYSDAIESFGNALEINPFHARSRYNLAIAYNRSGDRRAAEREYRFLLESDRGASGARARFNLGVLLMQAARVDEALEVFTQLLRTQPSNIDARFNHALLLARIGSTEKASEQYRRLLDLRPEHLRARLNLAALYMKASDCNSAIVQLDQLVSQAPGYALAHYNLGVCALRRSDPGAAIPHLMKAAALDPDLGRAHYNLALAFSRTGDTPLALENYAAAVKTTPDVASYRYNYALALSKVERFSESIDEYQAALRLDPEYYEARYNLALAHYRNNDYEAAQQVFKSALDQRPDSYESAYNLGLTWLKLKRATEAEEVLRKAIVLESTAAGHYNLGLALTRQGRYADANEEYEAVLRIDPKHARSIERLAEGKLQLGDHNDALSRLEQLGRIQPDDPTALNIGIRLLRFGRYPLAERYLEVAASSRESARARYNLGLALTRQDRHAEAGEHYQAVLRIDPDHARAVERLAEGQIQLKNHDGALASLEQLSRLAPGDPTALNAGIRLLRAGEYVLARRYFETAALGSPRLRARSLDLIGRVLTELDPDAALVRMREAAREFPDDPAIARRLRRVESAAVKNDPKD